MRVYYEKLGHMLKPHVPMFRPALCISPFKRYRRKTGPLVAETYSRRVDHRKVPCHIVSEFSGCHVPSIRKSSISSQISQAKNSRRCPRAAVRTSSRVPAPEYHSLAGYKKTFNMQFIRVPAMLLPVVQAKRVRSRIRFFKTSITCRKIAFLLPPICPLSGALAHCL